MKLTDLEPKWLSHDVFSFLCPHCRQITLLCKSEPMSHADQAKVVNASNPGRVEFIWTQPDCAWTITGEFDDMTVTPSIDASAAGHWHGHITGGAIVP